MKPQPFSYESKKRLYRNISQNPSGTVIGGHNVDRLKQIMEKNNVDVLLATSPDNVYYASRFRALEPHTTTCSVVLPRDGKPVLLVPKSEEGFITEECSVEDRRFYGEFYVVRSFDVKSLAHDFVAATCNILKEVNRGKGTVGFEEKHVPYALADELKKRLPKVKLACSSGIFEETRMIKSEEEIRRIRDAVRIAEDALLETYKEAREGQSELEFAQNLKTSIIRRGAEVVFAEMGAGTRSGLSTHPSEYKMRKGDVVHVDFGLSYHGYSSDMCRNAALVKETEEHVKINNALKAAHQEVLTLMKPGLKISEIFNTAVRTVREKGVANFRRHHVGHGIGIPPHEPPRINSANDRKLEAGMTLCIETPYYVSNFGGFNIENVVVVTKDGCETISRMSQDLFILPVC